MASWREKLAASAGMSLKAYLKTDAYKKEKAKRDNKDSKKDEKKASKETEKYYKEKESTTKTKAKTETERLQEDLNSMLESLGIQKTRAIENYETQIGNIEENKDLDLDTLNEYVSVNTGRTQEDLDTSLAKETRRYSLEQEQINENLADRGLTFSERTPEKIAKETSQIAMGDINTQAQRSFADIARYEATKNREIEIKYGQQEEAAGTSKTRTLEDIIKDQEKAQQSAARTGADIQSGLKENLSDLGYQKKDALSDISNYYDERREGLASKQEEYDFMGA